MQHKAHPQGWPYIMEKDFLQVRHRFRCQTNSVKAQTASTSMQMIKKLMLNLLYNVNFTNTFKYNL